MTRKSSLPTARQTKQRDAVLRVLEEAPGPVGVPEILRLAQQSCVTLGQATVYRHLKRLVAADRIFPVALPGGETRFESKRRARTHHHHFHCRVCDAVLDLEGCPVTTSDRLPPGFRVESHDLTFYGVCGGCA